MWPDRVSNPGPLTYESGALPTALRGPAAHHVKMYLDFIEIPSQNSCSANVCSYCSNCKNARRRTSNTKLFHLINIDIFAKYVIILKMKRHVLTLS